MAHQSTTTTTTEASSVATVTGVAMTPTPPVAEPPTALTYRQRVIHGPYSAAWESTKAQLIESGNWLPPTFIQMNCDIALLDGKTVFIEGMGEAEIVSHTRRCMTPNGSIVRFPNNLVVELKLERKDNGGVHWLVRRDTSGGTVDAQAALWAEVEALRKEYLRMCRSSTRRLSFGPLCDGAIPFDPVEAREFLVQRIHKMRVIKKRQGQVCPLLFGAIYGQNLGAAAAASGAGLLSSTVLVPLGVMFGSLVALQTQDDARAWCAVNSSISKQAKNEGGGVGGTQTAQVVYASEALDAPLVNGTTEAA